MSGADREKWNDRYRVGAYTERSHPSALLEDCIEDIPPGRALDVACGAGRNSLYLAERGFIVDAVDISGEALERAKESEKEHGLSVNWMECDLDQPLKLDGPYQLIVVIRYVNLPLIQKLTDSLAPGGFLVCEQHLETEVDVIGPRNPAFRVKSGDLLEVAAQLRILQFEEAVIEDPDGRNAALARLVAQKN